MTPVELMKAIVLAPVDLLFNGGIGTYVKAETESNNDAGDKSNDAVRVNGAQLRCKVVGEGGNLGFTQRGRIEYALAGGRICTDFIDNSAGVDTSDHEVNIKILLDKLTAAGDMTEKQRATLLHAMTDEVAELVLKDNYQQNLSLASSEAVAPSLLHVHQSWVRRLEHNGLLDREIEFLPSDKDFAARRAAGLGLTTPELSVLLAYTKIALEKELVEGDLPDDLFLRDELHNYFPTKLRAEYAAQIDAHALRRQIVVTQVVNSLINFAGITFFHRLSLETGATAEDLARAHHVCRDVYGVDSVIQQINALDNLVDSSVQTGMRLTARTLIERATRWLANNRRAPLDSKATIEYFGDEIRKVVAALPDVLCGIEQDDYAARRDDLVKAGVPERLAITVASYPPAYAALEDVETARRLSAEPVEVARVQAELGRQLGIPHLLARVVALPRADRWQTMARATLRDELHSVQAALTAQVMSSTPAAATPAERVEQWQESEAVVVQRASNTLQEIMADGAADLARLSVGLRVLRAMLPTP